ncbi:MAG: hypothetical protein HY815_24860 [Candidatus Riflebacteria bacterium]|nr:hypothetical protein [Candidatus Riflebacteria bacterium]
MARSGGTRATGWATVVAASLALVVAGELMGQAAGPTAQQVAEFNQQMLLIAHRRLAETLKDPSLLASVDVIEKRMPAIFWDLNLRLLMGIAALQPEKIPADLRAEITKEKIDAARKDLKKVGLLEPLKDKMFRKAILYSTWKARVFGKLAAFDKPATEYFKKQRAAANARACIAAQKTLAGAIEMYVLDKNVKAHPWNTIDEAQEPLTKGGYLKTALTACPADGAKYELKVTDGCPLVCKSHGTPTKPGVPSDPTDKGLEASNPLVWAAARMMEKAEKK